MVAIAVPRRQAQQRREVFYRNGADVVLAFDATPVKPHKACEQCHDKATYGARLAELERRVALPKLVATRDYYAERAIEEVVEIAVVDLGTASGLPGQARPKGTATPSSFPSRSRCMARSQR